MGDNTNIALFFENQNLFRNVSDYSHFLIVKAPPRPGASFPDKTPFGIPGKRKNGLPAPKTLLAPDLKVTLGTFTAPKRQNCSCP